MADANHHSDCACIVCKAQPKPAQEELESDPWEDLEEWQQPIMKDWDEVAEQLRYHPGILEALGFQHNRAGSLSVQELASAMQIDRLVVAKAIKNSSVLGQSDSIAAHWGKHIVFFYAPSSPAKRQQTLGYDIQFSGRGPRKVFRAKVHNPPESESIIVVDDYDHFLKDVNAAFLIKDAIA